jgi:nitrate reductase (NAD(P)H)
MAFSPLPDTDKEDFINPKLPPTPPETDDGVSDKDARASAHSSSVSISQILECGIPLPPPSIPPTEVLQIDQATPDSWLPRDPRLIRLTGVHPFNVEAPLSELYDQGFLTSPELFFVRNHGAVPQVKDEEVPDWEFSIEGFVA